MNKYLVSVFTATCFLLSAPAFAAHPLATDDTGTNGQLKFQLETSAEFGWDKQDAVRATSQTIGVSLSAGLLDSLDLVLSFPFAWQQQRENGTTVRINGVSDMALDLKWRFLEMGPASFAVKPGVIIPSGSRDKGLGNGRPGYGLTLVSTIELKPVAVHANIGYTHQNYTDSDLSLYRDNLWSFSLASVIEVAKGVQLVAGLDTSTNPDRSSTVWPTAVIGGVIYSVLDSLDLDLGVKAGLSRPETDITLLTGITCKFL